MDLTPSHDPWNRTPFDQEQSRLPAQGAGIDGAFLDAMGGRVRSAPRLYHKKSKKGCERCRARRVKVRYQLERVLLLNYPVVVIERIPISYTLFEFFSIFAMRGFFFVKVGKEPFLLFFFLSPSAPTIGISFAHSQWVGCTV